MATNTSSLLQPPLDTQAWLNGVRAAWQRSGLRITGPRLRVIETIVSYRAPFSAEQLYADLCTHSDAPGRATVYRTIDQLHASGWLARIHGSVGEEGYIPCQPGHLHHLVCTQCGAVTSFEGCDIEQMIANVAAQTGFSVEGHLLQLFGRCAKCRSKDQATS
ncbi:Fur family transcriptional regulator [Chloroflexus aggregans]|jgi:Fur family ferric uptake transcriptional regulator|uniref:Ferric uptake regulator, Fur family n=1 Tax=Chloroflexus aggregans (strain MD-66 / DSM 9485) TaxID=326427 RepID=B8G976_CHLAD|nr:Fur family transcriptional regulator [Chloroflexus aggregans]ACL24366.1 ferric uptake regulator, Fur family [Chloroflexus aggregans DSM 9485]